MNRNEFARYISEEYGVEGDFPFEKYPGYMVFRHQKSGKWFAVAMELPREKLGIEGDGAIDVVNLKCDPLLIGSLRCESGFFPAYHMSKGNWITAALDGSVDDEHLMFLVDMSFELTKAKKKTRR